MKVDELELREALRNVVIKALDEKEDKDKKDTECEKKYKAYFKQKLEKYDVKDPEDLSGKKKKKFFNEVEKGWDEDNCKPKKNESLSKRDKERLKEIFSSYISNGVSKQKILKKLKTNL